MKKLILFSTIIISIAFIYLGINNIISIPTNPNTQTREIQQISYIVKEYDGKLAVYNSSDEKTPIAVYDVYIHLLPESDIELLRKGISIFDEESLQKTLEDFGL